jgi:hypothetical protein
MTRKEIASTLVRAMQTPMVPTFTVTLRDGRSFDGFPCGQRDPGTDDEAYVFMLRTGNQAVVSLSLIGEVVSQ